MLEMLTQIDAEGLKDISSNSEMKCGNWCSLLNALYNVVQYIPWLCIFLACVRKRSRRMSPETLRYTYCIYICKQLDTYTEYTELVAGIIGNHAMQSPESKALRLPCSVASGTNKEVKGLKQRLGMDVSSVGGNIT